MAFKIKSTKVIDDIVDENNTPIGKIEFDPQDAEAYRKFLNLVDIVTEYEKIDRQIGSLENIPSFNAKKIEEFEQYRGIFNKLGQKLDNYIKMRDEIKKITDEIFGNVSESFEKISASIDPYIELISWATPRFKSGREDRVNQYINDTEDVL